MDFTNKNVLITGGSRGIGRATAMAFAKKGAHVAIIYKSNTNAAVETLKQLPGTGHLLLQSDISLESGAEKAVHETVAALGSIDILINNAGISVEHPIDEVDFNTWISAWKTTLDTNLFAVANMCWLVARVMIKNGGGRIVNVSSRGAFRGEPNKPAYGAGKAALNSLTQSLAKALAKYNIFAGVVAPGFTDTEMASVTLTETERKRLLEESPFKRMAKPEEVAHAILFLASEGSEYCSGTIIDVNGASYFR